MQEVQKIQVQSLGQEDPLEEMATHSGNICHGQRSLMGYSPWDSPGKNTGVGCREECKCGEQTG